MQSGDKLWVSWDERIDGDDDQELAIYKITVYVDEQYNAWMTQPQPPYAEGETTPYFLNKI